jgi:hypothetical protein
MRRYYKGGTVAKFNEGGSTKDACYRKEKAARLIGRTSSFGLDLVAAKRVLLNLKRRSMCNDF